MSNRLVTIQQTVPICPNCGAGMTLNASTHSFICHDCHSRYSIVDHGQTEREFICKEFNPNGGSKDGN